MFAGYIEIFVEHSHQGSNKGVDRKSNLGFLFFSFSGPRLHSVDLRNPQLYLLAALPRCRRSPILQGWWTSPLCLNDCRPSWTRDRRERTQGTNAWEKDKVTRQDNKRVTHQEKQWCSSETQTLPCKSLSPSTIFSGAD